MLFAATVLVIFAFGRRFLDAFGLNKLVQGFHWSELFEHDVHGAKAALGFSLRDHAHQLYSVVVARGVLKVLDQHIFGSCVNPQDVMG